MDIVVYTKIDCVLCDRVKKIFRVYKVPFEEKNLDLIDGLKEELAKRGIRQVPVIEVDGMITSWGGSPMDVKRIILNYQKLTKES